VEGNKRGMITEKQKATLYRMQRGGLKLARTEGQYIILSKNGDEVAQIQPNGEVYHKNQYNDIPK
jgi:hypothetical protein